MESVGLNSECYNNAVTFLEDYNTDKYGCIVTDVRMPVMGGIQMFEQLNLRKNRMPVILLTAHGDIPMAVNAMKNGAMDFIIKPYNAQYLVKQIQKSIALNIQQRFREPSEKETASVAELSKREKQIFFLVSAGELNKQISVKLSIANSTVEFHRSRLMKKLGAKNLTELIKIHIRSQEIKD